MKITFDLGVGNPFTVDIDGSTKLTDNFTFTEFANNKANEDIKGVVTPDVVKFAMMLQEMRNWAGSMHCNSWYRTVTFNKACGGDVGSQHTKGLAFDWGINNQTDSDREEVKAQWKKICKQHGVTGQLNFYTHGYHLAIRPEKDGTSFTLIDYRGKKGDW